VSDAGELVALDSTSTFELGVEHRFPLDLTSTRPSTWEAYESSLVDVWDPEDDTWWVDFEPDQYSAEAREAGALVWSHHTWVEHSAIAESEAVLVRSCLEPHVSTDFKYCVSMRAVERARSTDLAHIVSSRLDRYHPAPQGTTLSGLLDDELARRVLHARSDLDAYIGAHLVGQATIDLRAWECARANQRTALGALFDLVIRDKARMLEVAWDHVADAASQRDAGGRDDLAASINYVLFEEEGRGRQLPALLEDGPDKASLVHAHNLASVAGLGGVAEADQLDVFARSVAELSKRFASIGIDIGQEND